MIESIEFKNFRNLNTKFKLEEKLNVIFGKNSTGKSNLLSGIKLAFSSLNGDYFKLSKSDFLDSDDSKTIIITTTLKEDSIPSLISFDENGKKQCGFILKIYKNNNSKYIKKLTMLNGAPIDYDTVRDDSKVPKLYEVPFIRISDLYTDGLTIGLSTFIESEEQYKNLVDDFSKKVKENLSDKITKFKNLCSKFNENLDIETSDPKFNEEKVYIVDGNNDHNANIGSGYKSVANILLNTLNENHNIILVDEIENHLHPQLIRTLLRELRKIDNTTIISTTHSPIIINELEINELQDINGNQLKNISSKNIKKLQTFMHSGRSELCLADNIILVEGYTEELLLKKYVIDNNKNWTIINVAGVMFEPYIEIATLLNKNIITISDNDVCLSKNLTKSNRFCTLEKICRLKKVKLIEVDNTLESDLFKNGFLSKEKSLLKKNEKHNEYYVAKERKKTEIAQKLIELDTNIEEWHVIKEINETFKDN